MRNKNYPAAVKLILNYCAQIKDKSFLSVFSLFAVFTKKPQLLVRFVSDSTQNSLIRLHKNEKKCL